MGVQEDLMAEVNGAHGMLQNGDGEGAIQRLDGVIERSVSGGWVVVEAAARGLVAQALALAERHFEAELHVARGLEIAKSLGDAQGIAHFESLKNLVQKPVGEPEEISLVDALRLAKSAHEDRDDRGALSLLEPLVAAAREQGEVNLEGSALGLLAKVQFRLGNRHGAVEAAQGALAISTHHGQEQTQRYFKDLLEHIEAGDLPQAEGPSYSERLATLGQMAESGQLVEAIKGVHDLLEDCRLDQAKGVEATALHLLSQLLLHAGQRTQALSAIDHGLALVDAMGDEGARASFEAIRAHLLDA